MFPTLLLVFSFHFLEGLCLTRSYVPLNGSYSKLFVGLSTFHHYVLNFCVSLMYVLLGYGYNFAHNFCFKWSYFRALNFYALVFFLFYSKSRSPLVPFSSIVRQVSICLSHMLLLLIITPIELNKRMDNKTFFKQVINTRRQKAQGEVVRMKAE